MATYTFTETLVFDVNPGGVYKALRNAAVTVKNASTGAVLFTVTSDSNGLVTFSTTDVPTVILVSGSFSRRVTSQDAIESAAGYTVSEDAAIAANVNGSGTATQGALNGRYNTKTQINVADYATPQAAMAALTSGATIVFPQATYALTGGATLQPAAGVNDVTVLARGATFTQDTWGKPVFDLLDVHGWTLDIGLAQYVGTRGDHTNVLNGGNSVRGQAVYALGSGVYTNGDRHHIRYLRTIGMPTPVNLSSWNGTSITGRYGVGNRIGRLECEGYDFGVLWIGQRNLVIEDLYAHDDIDDSSGANPTHAYYCTATTAWRSNGVTIKKARCENNLYGHAYQLKNCDQTQLGPHSADNCKGLINVIDCDDLSWTDMKGTAILTPIAGNASCVTLATVTNQSKRPVLKNTSVTCAANQDTTSGLVSIQADDAQIGDMLVVANHSSSVNTGTSDIILRGVNGRLRNATLKSIGADHCRGIAVLNTPSVSTGWKIDKPTVSGQRSLLDVQSGCTGTGIDYDPDAQTITGGGAAVVGATTDVYVRGSVLMGKVATGSGLVLTGTATDIPSATVTLNPPVAGKLFVSATFDCTSAAVEPLAGSLVVDGTTQSGTSLFTASAGTRGTVGQTWVVSLAAGSHTIKLQGQRVGGTGTTHAMNATHTGFSYQFVPGAA